MLFENGQWCLENEGLRGASQQPECALHQVIYPVIRYYYYFFSTKNLPYRYLHTAKAPDCPQYMVLLQKDRKGGVESKGESETAILAAQRTVKREQARESAMDTCFIWSVLVLTT